MLDLDSIEIDVAKADAGSYWSLTIDDQGKLLANPIAGPDSDPKNAWIQVKTPGIAYDRALARAREPFLANYRDGSITDEDHARVCGQALATLVVGWGRFVVGGKPFNFNSHNLMAVMTERKWESVRLIIDAVANSHRQLLVSNEEASLGNSQPG